MFRLPESVTSPPEPASRVRFAALPLTVELNEMSSPVPPPLVTVFVPPPSKSTTPAKAIDEVSLVYAVPFRSMFVPLTANSVSANTSWRSICNAF